MLIRSQQEEIGFLRRELERKDAVLLNMIEAVKALNPPQEAAPETRDAPASVSEGRGGGDVSSEAQGQEKPISWWRRWFG